MSRDGLQVWAGGDVAGQLFRAESQAEHFWFTYDAACRNNNAVSLTMPVMRDPYSSQYRLHPVFDMNLPEGALGERLRKEFGKVIPRFDDLTLLGILGASQIGRLRFLQPERPLPELPREDLNELLLHDGAQGLFDNLLDRYARFSGIAGAQPKVLLRGDDTLGRLSHRGASHILKAWHEAEYPQLAANEFFCMRAAHLAGLPVPECNLSAQGKFLLVTRFDLKDGHYLGFEDFCVLNGKTSGRKYDGSYESLVKRIRDFVSPKHLLAALEQFFKTLVLSCIVKNGDAHLKNFGVLYDDMDGEVWLSPTYDVVTTTPYHPKDILALTLNGSKRWPKAATLIAFARNHIGLSVQRSKVLIDEVAQGVVQARRELTQYISDHPTFDKVGKIMLREWSQGLGLSTQFDSPKN